MKLIILIILVAIILYFIYNISYRNKQNKKVLRYFGAHYCPHSNENSNAYKVIKEFEDKYGNQVQIIYYWSEENQEEMKNSNIMYVPTILNNDNTEIQLGLPDNINRDEKTVDELKDILLKTIYNRL